MRPEAKTGTRIGYVNSLRAGGTYRTEVIDLRNVRSLSITVRVTYHASATKGITVKFYFSPDGKHWDTVPYSQYQPDFTAGETVQETVKIEVPEWGYLQVEVKNEDGSYPASDIYIWRTIKTWKPQVVVNGVNTEKG